MSMMAGGILIFESVVIQPFCFKKNSGFLHRFPHSDKRLSIPCEFCLLHGDSGRAAYSIHVIYVQILLVS